jgi:hypothetical protein
MFDGLVYVIVAAWGINFVLLCLALYFLFSSGYNFLSLIIAAVIFLFAIVYHATKNSSERVLENIGHFSFPIALFGAIYDSSLFGAYFFFVIGLIVNYLSVFAIVNLIYKILTKVFSD